MQTALKTNDQRLRTQEAFTLPNITNYRREKLTGHAMAVLEAQAALNEQGGILNFLHTHSGQEGDGFYSWLHYPKGDRIDYKTGGQYMYHCHREDFETEEHGHFHTFVRKVGWPKGMSRAQLPDKERFAKHPMTHVICIAMNRVGKPIRLFTVNRWVANDTWFEAKKLARLTKKFACRPEKEAELWAPMDTWLENMMHLFQPQVLWLQEQRDAEMKRLIAQDTKNYPETHYPYQDKAIEELSSLPISIEGQVQWLMG